MHTCVDQYNANKATNGNGGLKWIQKGGGYYGEDHQEAERRRLSIGLNKRGRLYRARPRLTFIEQFLGRFCDQRRAFAPSRVQRDFLAEDEAVEQERLRIGVVGRQTRRAIEMPDILQPRGIDAGHRAEAAASSERAPYPGSPVRPPCPPYSCAPNIARSAPSGVPVRSRHRGWSVFRSRQCVRCSSFAACRRAAPRDRETAGRSRPW